MQVETIKCYHNFLKQEMWMTSTRRRWQTFLNGTSYCKATNQSLLKYLPKEIILQIWYEYAVECIEEIELAIIGFLTLLKERYYRNPESVYSFHHFLGVAIRHGHMDMYLWLLEEATKRKARKEEDKHLFNSDMMAAIDVGNLDFVKLLWTKVDYKKNIFMYQENAARWGHLHIIEYMYEVGSLKISETTVVMATKKKKLDILNWVFTKTKEPFTKCLVYIAVENEDYDVLEWLFTNVWLNEQSSIAKVVLTNYYNLPKKMIQYLTDVSERK